MKPIAKPADIPPARGMPKFVAAIYNTVLIKTIFFFIHDVVGALSASDLPSVFVTEPVLENMQMQMYYVLSPVGIGAFLSTL